MRRRIPVAILAVIAMAAEARSETVHLYAAGSLRAALSDMAKAFEAESGTAVEAKYGPSGTLKDEIAAGAKADVFAKMDCPGLRKSIRFYVASDPIVLQISGASVEVISIAVGSVR